MSDQIDLKSAVSTKAPGTWNTGPGITQYDRLWLLINGVPTRVPKKEPRRFCGGEFAVGSELLGWDCQFEIASRMYPDMAAWFDTYLFGGGAYYTLAGSGDPYTHTDKLMRKSPSKKYPDFFGLAYWYDGDTTYWEYPACQLTRGKWSGTFEGDDDSIKFDGTVLTSGKRNEITSGFTEPSCTEEICYRMGDLTPHFGPMAGSDIAIDLVSFDVEINNNLDPNPKRSGLYRGAPRVFGPREVTATLTVLAEPGDAPEDRFDANDEMYLNLFAANPVLNRVWSRYLSDLEIVALDKGYSRFNQQDTSIIHLRGLLDPTDATTRANTPIYGTVQTGTATYRR